MLQSMEEELVKLENVPVISSLFDEYKADKEKKAKLLFWKGLISLMEKCLKTEKKGSFASNLINSFGSGVGRSC
jgi:5'-deoxynucleotidase YfbR-like HD superfamily hydrolase